MTDAGKRSRIDPSVRGRFVGKGRAKLEDVPSQVPFAWLRLGAVFGFKSNL